MGKHRRTSKLDEMIDAIDLDWVVEELYGKLDEASVEKIQASKQPSDMYGMHFGFGMSIRNYYGLWDPESPLHKWFHKELGIVHADDMSGIIMEALWHRAKDLKYDPSETIKRYTEHWAKCGLNLDQTPIGIHEERTA